MAVNGSTANAVSPVKVEITGANQKIALSESVGDDVFLQHQLERIGERLQQAVRADAHGAEAHLEIGEHFALDQHDVSRDQREQRDDHQGHQDRHEQRMDEDRRPYVVYRKSEVCARRRNGSG